MICHLYFQDIFAFPEYKGHNPACAFVYHVHYYAVKHVFPIFLLDGMDISPVHKLDILGSDAPADSVSCHTFYIRGGNLSAQGPEEGALGSLPVAFNNCIIKEV